MSWSLNEPVDSTFPARDIDEQINNDRAELRARFVAHNEDFNTHSDPASEDSGRHPLSRVGFARVHDSVADMESFTPKVPGSLHGVLSPRSLYVIDESNSPVRIFPVSHGDLEGLDANDHPQYQREGLESAFTGHLTILGTLTLEDAAGGGSSALRPSHADDDWETAHGVETLQNEHIADGGIPATVLIPSVYTGEALSPQLGRHSFPWCPGDTGSTKFCLLMLCSTSGEWVFRDPLSGTQARIRAGVYST